MYATDPLNDIAVYAHVTPDTSTPYRKIKLQINPYLALMSAFEVVLSPNAPKEPIDQRHAQIRTLLEQTLTAFNIRLSKDNQLRIE